MKVSYVIDDEGGHPLSTSIRNGSIAIMLFGLVLVGAVWFGLYNKLHSEQQLVINSAVKNMANLTRAFEEHTLRTIKSADQTVLLLKYQYEKEGRALDISPYVRGGKLWTETFVLLSIADENGDLIISNQTPFVASNMKDLEHFLIHQKTDSGHLFISQPVLGRSSGKWSIQMTRRINKPDGSFGGVVVASVDPLYFTSFYKQVDLGEQSSIGLVGRDGIGRAWQSDRGFGFGQDLIKNTSAVIEQLSVSEAGNYIGRCPIDGAKMLYSYRALQEYPMVVLVGIREAEVLEDFYKRRANYHQVAFFLSILIIVGAVGLTLNLAERKRIEREMARLEKLNLVGEMAASIAHEIRNPMTTVRGFLQVIAQKDHEYREFFDIMIEELDRANAIISEYLALAVTKITLRSKVDINAVIGILAPLIEADGLKNNISVIFNLEKTPHILIDEKEFRQLLLNLVRNSFDAMKRGKCLIIKTYQNEYGEVVLLVQDQGAGISAVIKERIGTPFFTTKSSGTGLGLAVCYSIVARHQATISYESDNNGTTFYVKFKQYKE